MTEADLITRVTQEIKGLSSNFVTADYINAVDSAQEETSFALPNTINAQIRWLVQRTKRYLIHALWVQNATKFKVKQLSLNQKFEQLGKLIEEMDKEFAAAQAAYDFGMEVPAITAPAWAFFSHKIDAGFLNDPTTGQDLTYTDDNEVIITPTGEETT